MGTGQKTPTVTLHNPNNQPQILTFFQSYVMFYITVCTQDRVLHGACGGQGVLPSVMQASGMQQALQLPPPLP